MGVRDRLRARALDWAMRWVDELRDEALAGAEGDVLEVGFGTGLNLPRYPSGVRTLVALDPNAVRELPAMEARLRSAAFLIERCNLRADTGLPFDTGRFDCVVTTWTLCSIPEPLPALREMRRVLRPGGRYLFIEHGTADNARTALWQDRLNPLWCRIADGCNMNRRIDRLVVEGGFELTRLERFRHRGAGVLAHMYRGAAVPAA